MRGALCATAERHKSLEIARFALDLAQRVGEAARAKARPNSTSGKSSTRASGIPKDRAAASSASSVSDALILMHAPGCDAGLVKNSN